MKVTKITFYDNNNEAVPTPHPRGKVQLEDDSGRYKIMSTGDFKNYLISRVKYNELRKWKRRVWGRGQTTHEMVEDIFKEANKLGSRGSHSEGRKKRGGKLSQKTTSQLYDELKGSWCDE